MEKKEIKIPHYNTVNPFVIIKGGATKFIDFVEKVFDGKENKQVRTPDRDGTLIHAEIQIGDSMILLADSKADWAFTPAFLQIYVDNAQQILEKAKTEKAEIITELSDFYNGLKLARLKDPFGNIWWLYEKVANKPSENKSDIDWHNSKPSEIYTTLMNAMKNLK
ncbi:VOC family protein [Capnocytophaga canis]|uniref:VOC family protein n=1 Tax=Capnocytophaga canis TaxID=1848903 RepID=UPI0037CD8982